jgi:hypothetical protein
VLASAGPEHGHGGKRQANRAGEAWREAWLGHPCGYLQPSY